jgi:hypothetical protein
MTKTGSDNLSCRACGTVHGVLHSHHIIPKSVGGGDEPENRVVLCSDCHYKVHHAEEEDGDIVQFSEEYRSFIETNILSEGWGMIPNKVLHDPSLTPFAKILYSELSSLAAKRGYCWATNQYLADKFGVHRDTVSKAISSISKYVIFEDRTSDRRKIWVHTLKSTPRRLRRTNLGDKSAHNNIIEEHKKIDAPSGTSFPKEQYRAVADHFVQEYQRLWKVSVAPAVNFPAANKLLKAHFTRGLTVKQINAVITSFLDDLRWNEDKIKPSPDLLVILSSKHFNRHVARLSTK